MCVLRVLCVCLCVGDWLVCVRNSSYSVCESLMYVLPVSVCGSVFEWSYCRYFWECAPLLRA